VGDVGIDEPRALLTSVVLVAVATLEHVNPA
jgi:hypothetical protein